MSAPGGTQCTLGIQCTLPVGNKACQGVGRVEGGRKEVRSSEYPASYKSDRLVNEGY